MIETLVDVALIVVFVPIAYLVGMLLGFGVWWGIVLVREDRERERRRARGW